MRVCRAEPPQPPHMSGSATKPNTAPAVLPAGSAIKLRTASAACPAGDTMVLCSSPAAWPPGEEIKREHASAVDMTSEEHLAGSDFADLLLPSHVMGRSGSF